jgi:hypothetical protein
MHHEFDVLKQWGELSDGELQKIANDDAIALLERVTRLLEDELNHEKPVVVAATNFAALVREMVRRYKEGSWQLGEAIIEAGELSDRKAYGDAKQIYDSFLRKCPWKFYRAIARTQLDRLASRQ